ncbi:reverse transcriptase domain-containing protein [Tanacetum coccineum]
MITTGEVEADPSISPTEALDLVDYSSFSDSDPSEDSLPLALDLPLVSPFLCSDDSEADSESEPAEQRPVSSSHDTLAPLSEFHLAPVVAPPGIRRQPSILFRPDEAIPFGRLYRTHLNGLRKLLTARKRVGPIPACRLAWRRVSHHSSNLHSSPDLSSSSLPSDHSLSGHTPPDTTDADSSTPQIFVNRSLARTLRRISEGVIAHTEDGVVLSLLEGEVNPDLRNTILDIVHYMSEVRIERFTEIKTTSETVGVVLILEYLKVRAMLSIERDQIDIIRWHMALSHEEFCQNGSDGDNGNGSNGNGENGNGNPNENDRGDRPVARECTYQDFMKCQPLNFKGTEGVVRLMRWFEKMETVFHISNCPEKYQRELMKLMTEVYCPRNEIQKMESELWNLTVKNNDLAAYTQRFQELKMMCNKMVPEEEDRVEKFIGGLPDNIQRNVIDAEPTRQQDAVRIANNLMDQKLKGYAVKNDENKRRFEVNQRDNRRQKPPFKRPNFGGQNVARAYTADNNKKKSYNGPLSLCNKCKLHHKWPCIVRRGKCNKVGHLTRDYKCGRQGHCRSDCLKLKDQNRGNKAGNKNEVGEARGKAYVLGGGEANPDPNIIKDTFLLNNHYASTIFDSGADRSFVSTTFSTLLDITPNTLDVSYAVELADRRISETNTILRGCTLGLLGHPFNIDLMPVELGRFDIIIGMDWLANHHAVIVCDEKIIRIPYGDKVLIVQGERDDKGEKSKLNIISCTKTQKYIKRGFPIFLAQVMKKEIKNESEEKRFKSLVLHLWHAPCID